MVEQLTLIQKICVWALPVIFALTLHEVAHGLAALYFGDHTARLSGRLSINPLHHMDWLGTLVLPLFLLSTSNFVFGWAKPVPIDERNINPARRQQILACIALVGPLANIFMAILWGGIAKVGNIIENTSLTSLSMPIIYMGHAGIIINIILAVLNLIPLPPLDGSKVAYCLLPSRLAYTLSLLEPYGFFILLLLLWSGLLSYIMQPCVALLFYVVSDLFNL